MKFKCVVALELIRLENKILNGCRPNWIWNIWLNVRKTSNGSLNCNQIHQIKIARLNFQQKVLCQQDAFFGFWSRMFFSSFVHKIEPFSFLEDLVKKTCTKTKKKKGFLIIQKLYLAKKMKKMHVWWWPHIT
jgi:hypothetical protein